MYISILRGVCILTAFGSWAPMLSKFSILMLYHRLNPSKPFRIIIYIIMAIIVGYAMGSTVVVSRHSAWMQSHQLIQSRSAPYADLWIRQKRNVSTTLLSSKQSSTSRQVA